MRALLLDFAQEKTICNIEVKVNYNHDLGLSLICSGEQAESQTQVLASLGTVTEVERENSDEFTSMNQSITITRIQREADDRNAELLLRLITKTDVIREADDHH